MSIVAAALFGLTALISSARFGYNLERKNSPTAVFSGVMALVWLGLSVAAATNS